MDQDTLENTDGNYINMQIEELPYYRKDEDAYLKIPGDNDDLENTFLPVLIASPKKKVNKKTKNKKQKGRPKTVGRPKKSRRVKSGATLFANLRR
jgi:hypothetical protein